MELEQSGAHPRFQQGQIDDLLRAWGIDVPGDLLGNLNRAKEAYTWLQEKGMAEPIQKKLSEYISLARELQLPEDFERGFLVKVTTGGVFVGSYRTSGDEFDVRWSGYNVELIITPRIDPFDRSPWVWWPLPYVDFLGFARKPHKGEVTPEWDIRNYLIQRHSHDLIWAILCFCLWKDGEQVYLKGRWDPSLGREKITCCDINLEGKGTADLLEMARIVSRELGHGGRPPGLTVPNRSDRIAIIREQTREYIRDGIPAGQAAIGRALGLSESTMKRYLRDAGYRDWGDFLVEVS